MCGSDLEQSYRQTDGMVMLSVSGCGCRDLVVQENNLELVLTRAFLEVDKALQKHLHLSPSGRSLHTST